LECRCAEASQAPWRLKKLIKQSITAAASARRKSGSTKKVEVQAMLSLLDAQVDLNEPTSAEDCDAKAASPTVEITSGGDEYVVPFVSADHRSHWVLAYRTALDSAASLADC
jgi:hypothetical protein